MDRRTIDLRELNELEHLFDNAIVVTRIVIAPGKGEVGRITRIYFPSGPEPPTKGTK